MLKGSIVALVTPMNAAGQIELERVPALLETLLDGGSEGLVVAGTTGESASLSDGEFQALLERVIAVVDGRVPVLAGTGKAGTEATIAQTRIARACGADAALVVTPYYYRPMPSGLQAHFEAIANAVDLPLMLYNVPARTAVDLPVAVVERLSRLDAVIGIKEATPGTERIRALLDVCPEDFLVLSGDDPTCGAAMLAGARGVISVAANVAPAAMSELCRHALLGDQPEVDRMEGRLAGLFAQLGIETNPIPVKWGVHLLGLAGPGIRLPLLPLEAQHRHADDQVWG